MLAHHRANPETPPVEIPYLEPPPPRSAPASDAALAQPPAAPPTRTQSTVAAAPVPGGGQPEPLAPPLITDFAGTLDNNSSIPPDTHGAVGPSHIVNMLNTGFQVFNRTGTVVMPQISLSTFWSALGTAASGPFDPKIVFDQYVDRWVVVTDARAQSPNSNVLVGISHTDDPTAGWNLFAIKADPGSTTWADYPGLGLDEANVYVTQNMFTNNNNSFVTAKFWVISKASMIAGGPLDMRTDTPAALPGFTYQPCHSFDPSPGGFNYLVNQGWHIGGTPRRLINVARYVGIGAAAVLTELGFVEVGGYTFSHLNASQKDCGVAISTNDPRLMNAVLRNGSVWTTHSVGVGATVDPAPASRAEIAWHELDPTVANIPGPYSFANQDGRIGHATLAYYFPSIAVNGSECVAVGFSGSDGSTYASAYFTGRFAADPPGLMQPVATLRAGTASYWKQFGGTRNRWGDYSATVVDPLDDSTFWTTQEFATTPFFGGPICAQDGGRWQLWWGAITCEDIAKFSQPPDNTGHVISSDIDITDNDPNVVLADDFLSDGRPITAVRWWGSEFALPSPDGWLISFHEPLATGGSPDAPLGLYYCDTSIVSQVLTAFASCNANPVVEYQADLEDCCVLHSNADSRSGSFPAQPTAFEEEACFEYDLDIQAIVGQRYLGPGFCGAPVATGNSAATQFWGWHATGMESGSRTALQTSVSMSGSDWLYGPWTDLFPSCGAPNMAFEVLTNVGSVADCNNNSIPDACEAPDCQPNGVLDECEVASGAAADCNGNNVPDECDIAGGAPDCQPNGVLDLCEVDRVGFLVSSLPSILGFTDIAATGTGLGLADDGAVNVTMPFAPAFIGGATVSVANNGGVGFVPGTGLGPVDNWPLPHTNAFGGNAGMLVYWDDLHETTGDVYYQTIGSTPNRTFIVQWDDLEQFNLADSTLDGDEVTFQIQIYETPVSGIVAQYLYADTDFENGAYNNGASATVGYQDSLASALQWSFNSAGTITPSLVLSLAVKDLNDNGVPDECDPVAPPPTPMWDCPGGLGQTACVARTRALTFTMVPPATATNALPGSSAIRITMMDLQNPVPANDPCCPPPNFGIFEDASCTGDPGGAHSCSRWVGPPYTYLEAQELPGFGNYRASRLQCAPFYHDWSAEPGQLVNVIGAEILPSSTYAVRSYGSDCKGSEDTCSNVSMDVTMQTRRAGDIAPVFQDPAAGRTQPNAIDIVGAVNNFKKAVGAPKHIEAQVQPNLPNLNRDVDALDIQAIVANQKLGAYPYAGPCACPSTVTCNSTMCSGTNPCAPAGNLCLQTCSAGPRAGELCTSNKHCGMCVGGTRPGIPCDSNAQCDGGTCTTGTCNTQGFCRDRCGRCAP